MSQGATATVVETSVNGTTDRPENAVTPGWRRGFWSLVITQFQGAFNENGLKNLVVFIILGMAMQTANRDQLVLIVGTLFSVPFILFSMTGGFLADRYSKRTVTIWTKFFEVAVMLLAIAGLGWQNLHLEMAAVFLASTQAALFGPSKYGLLPELLPEPRLSWGNGVLELGTFLAVIAGGVSGAFLADIFHARQGWSGLIFLSLSFVGLIFSLGITKVPAADPTKKFRANPIGDLWAQGRLIRKDRVLWLAVLGNTYFWFLGALLTANIVFYGSDVLHISSTRTGILQAAVAIGIGLGSLTAGYLSSGKVEYGLIPLGSVGMTVFGVLLSRQNLSFAHVLVLLAALGFSAGFFAVPVNALIQHRPDEKDKGGVIAAANLLSFVGIGAAAGVYYAFQHYSHLSPPAIFLSASLVTVAATGYVLYLLPDALLRLLLWIATHSLYRIHLEGRQNVPAKGGALLVPNHVSMVDAVLLIASIDRPIRFLMFKGSYDHPLVKPFAKIMGVIPISSQLRPREMIQSLRTATQALNDGEIVVYLSRRPDDSHRADASVPARDGKDYERCGCPHHPREPGRCVGFNLQLRGRQVLVEAPTKDPLSGYCNFRKGDAIVDRNSSSKAGGSGTRCRSLSLPQALHAAAAPFLRANRAPASVPLRYGRWPHAETCFRQRPHSHSFSRTAALSCLA